jgi:multicomponent Na+:H+ antiporter subunit G
MVLDVLAAALTLAGAALALVAGVGMVRFPDVFARMHAATKPATLGLLLIVLGALLAWTIRVARSSCCSCSSCSS